MTISTQQLLEKFPLEQLRELASFGGLSDSAILRLLDCGAIMPLTAGDVLYAAGSKPSAFHIILSGKISLFREYRGKSIHTRTYDPGEQVGFAAIIALHDHKGAAVVEEDAWILKISAGEFFKLYNSASEDFALLMINLARGMARTIDSLTRLIAVLQES
ncbi:MAG: cyclic nucleotide-binding domain-containing protein [Gammaproteobacteria bacterium]|nr:cyclic nucleotide-binding domain-containing protein [Gammaproteobacteria bacterium]